MGSSRFKSASYRRTRLAFTLIELLVVMVIIGMLLGLVAIAGFGALKQAERSACKALISSLAGPLQAYKDDNGAFPPGISITGAPNYSAPTSPIDSSYIAASAALYTNLAGKSTYSTTTLTGKAYLTSLTYSQVGDPAGTGGTTSYIKDSFSYPLGYNTTNANNYGFFDIWSVGGPPSVSSGTNAWLTNWQ